ncbi:YqfQ family protein [Alkalicoccobacillus gibsonii]|uniref:YqfQ family protein n=1 Tax=Alkalicoccobacillus gibsonii TaxID=79881 RepID=UPI001FE90269|nr:YqfQ family protein [Alkalicoccobacillus gibsonii]
MQRIFGPPAGPTPIQPLARSPFMFGPGPGAGMVPPSAFLGGPGPQAASGFMQGAGGRVGLLARLFGGGGGASAVSGAAFPTAGASGGSFLSGINFTSILQNTQRIMGITQQVMPMVQQYGPIIRNAPALWRIMRSQSSSDTEEVTNEITSPNIPIQNEQETSLTPETMSPEALSPQVNVPIQPQLATIQSVARPVGGPPAPKLYV